MRKHLWLNLVTGVLMVCALIVTALVVRRELFPSSPESTPLTRKVPNWRTYSSDGHRFGPADAPVTITVFSDFQCPYCRMFATRINQVRQQYPGKLAVVYRHYPLHGHRYAVPAARASECAAAQGRFEAFHDALFEGQDAIGSVPWAYFAKAADIADLSTFGQCASDSGAVRAVARDTLAGQRLGVNATPTLLINDLLVRGAPSLERLRSYVASALDQTMPQ